MINPTNLGQQQFILSNIKKKSNQEEAAFQKLSSGKKITKASDDVIGNLKVQELDKAVRTLDTVRNITDRASSVLDVASGAYSQSLEGLQQLRELAVQAADDTLSASDRKSISTRARDITEGLSQLSRSVTETGAGLIDGSFQNKSVPVSDSESVTISLDSATPESLGVSDVDFSTAEGAQSAIDSIDAAIGQVAQSLVKTGSKQISLDLSSQANDIMKEKLSASRSFIEDVDLAKVTGEIKSLQVSKQTAISLLSVVQNATENSIKKLA